MQLIKLGFVISLCMALFSSCETYKNIPYFANLPDSARASVLNAPYENLKIKPDDILGINIQTLDPTGNTLFNQNTTSSFSSAIVNSGLSIGSPAQSNPITYLVDRNGEVELPLIGKIKVAGLATDEARDTIENRAKVYYVKPSVNVRFTNLKVTVLGEVLRPGTFILPNEKNTIFDALGLAGDLTIFGKRENVLLIRDSAGKSNLIRFNLNSPDILSKGFFFLKQNDVIYVEPNKSKIASLDAVKSRNYTIAAGVISILVVLATRVR